MTRISRRGLLQSGAAAGVLAATGLPGRAQGKRGGCLRLGLAGAHASDTWDARSHADTFMVMATMGGVFDCLTEIASNGELVGELAESWEASSDARVWTFNLRRGVAFHNGKAFGAEDVIASLNLHVADGSTSAARPIVENIAEMKRLGDHQVQMVLRAGNADFPFLLSDYHLAIYPAGQIDEAIAAGIGTGLYRVERFEPGVRAALRRVEGHYKDGQAGWFDTVELIAMTDPATRMAALRAGQVDAVNRVDVRDEAQMTGGRDVSIFEVSGNRHLGFPMRTDIAPFDDVDVRRALKHAVDRQEMVDNVLRGHGRVANDHPIGPVNQYLAGTLPQHGYDPDKARFHLRKAGYESLDLTLWASDAAFGGAVDAAGLLRASARAAGIDIDVREVPADGYWSGVWGTAPWRASSSSGRVTEDWMFSTVAGVGAPWNETRWTEEPFQKRLIEARATLDTARRAEMYAEMQASFSADGGALIPMYATHVDAASSKLTNAGTISDVLEMDGSRLIERWWFA
ncbi:peptide/nickel transport system substrate-binding protein [Tranquillimonas rosea]|uniref:Peptide/nickel transport system substrate-binding protein n=1 Tax=Tranquillimonas rosea TaxID=641238 RepID=A0A1H9UIA5_9RHOB|nr:ABC transporter substrate-binding protein [Tranquillimonas rosea]SES09018.1 peptide/nickel transport system substrate-binding protein [Tranquillimonas rosea]